MPCWCIKGLTHTTRAVTAGGRDTHPYFHLFSTNVPLFISLSPSIVFALFYRGSALLKGTVQPESLEFFAAFYKNPSNLLILWQASSIESFFLFANTLLLDEKIRQSSGQPHIPHLFGRHQTTIQTKFPHFLGTGLLKKMAVCAHTTRLPKKYDVDQNFEHQLKVHCVNCVQLSR
jgi:hypothetical protein